jgi:hypothetical protein
VLSFLAKFALGLAAAVGILRMRVWAEEHAPKAPAPRPRPTPQPRARAAHKAAHPVQTQIRKARESIAPRPAIHRPQVGAHRAPKPARPLPALPRRRRLVDLRDDVVEPDEPTVPNPTVDEKLARRFEILARTGQVVND